MKYIVPFLAFMLMSCILFAKKAPDPTYIDQFKNHYLNTKFAQSDYNRYQLADNNKQAQNVISFLKKEKPALFESGKGLKQMHFNESPFSTHYTYIQTANGLPIYSSQVKVNIDKSNAVYASFYNTFSFDEAVFPVSKKKLENPIEIIKKHYAASKDKISIDTAYNCIIITSENGEAVNAVVANISNKTKNWHHQVVINAQLELLYGKDLRTYFSAKKVTANGDTTATCKIFNPDPLTTAGVLYGTPFADFSDGDREILNNERQDAVIPVCLENGTFILASPYVVIKELERPEEVIPTSTTPDFTFTRSEPGFEDVNAHYHLNNFKLHINECGYDNLVDFPIEVDTHASNGADNSYFDPDLQVPGLLFGEGGVDDAEDADVIIHEYGHAITHSASPYTNNGKQRQSIDEGYGDYLAASYSRSINDFGWERVFSWDGHNSEWSGRFANRTSKYPDDLVDQIHDDGEIWASALMEIWPIMGRKELDKIVFGSLYNYASNTPMNTAAELLIKSDSLINNSENYFTIWSTMHKFGFLPYQAFAGNDTIICEGESYTLGGENVKLENSSLQWSPSESLSSPWVFNPVASPAVSTWYTLTVKNETTMETFVDSVFVDVQCEPATGIEMIGLSNSFNFLNGENLFLTLPDSNNKKYNVELFNIGGQKVRFHHEQFSGNRHQLALINTANGVYFLRVLDEDLNVHTFRFVKQ